MMLTERRLAHSAQLDGANSLRSKRRRAIWQASSPGKQTLQTLIGNYIAGSFVTPAGGTGGSPASTMAEPSPLLAHPHA
jgi:hypothetical protein